MCAGVIIKLMSVLTNKHVLVVGDENTQIFNLERSLEAYGVTIHTTSCDSVSSELLEENKIDIVLLNHLHDGHTCVDMLSKLRSLDLSHALPIFALVEDVEDKIESVLALGVADYITPSEDVHSIIQKMKVIFGEGDNFSGSTAIDITPIHNATSTKGIRVYVVEDDPLLRNLLSLRLEKSSFPYEFSGDGRQAIDSMKQFKPDVIILDLMLPGKSGFEVLSEIKSDNDLKDIPVIVFSNRDGQEDKRKAKELGAAGFYVKAMTDLSELIKTIEDIAK